MEGSALAGLAALMGHRAATICTIIAQRIALDVDTDYKPFVTQNDLDGARQTGSTEISNPYNRK